MEVLASIAKQGSVPAPPPSASVTPPVPTGTSAPGPAAPVPSWGVPPTNPPYQVPQQQPYAAPSAPASLATSIPGFPANLLAGLSAGVAPPNAPGGFPPAIPQAPAAQPFQAPAAPPAGGAAPGLDQVMLIKTLIDQGLQPNQISAILQSMSAPQGAPPGAPAYPAAPGQAHDGGWGASAQGPDYEANGRRGYPQERSRSKSPDRWGRDARGGYDRHGGPGQRPSSRDRDRDRPDYRQRSPMGRRSHGTPDHGHEPRKKWVEYDRSLRPGHIKGMYRAYSHFFSHDKTNMICSYEPNAIRWRCNVSIPER